MNSVDLAKYWLDSANSDYETMQVLYKIEEILGVYLLDI